MEDSTIWKVIESYFQNNPQALVKHHVDSYNQFYSEHIFQLFKDMNPIKLDVDYDKDIQDFRSKCSMYIGGKEGNLIYFGKPIIHDTNNPHYMYPNESRLRNMTYATTIHVDVEIKYTRILRETDVPTKLDDNGYAIYNELDMKEVTEQGNVLKKDYTPSEMAKLRENTKNRIQSNTQHVKMLLQKIYLGKFPIMVQSKLCIMYNMPREMRFSLGECKNDIGGYFIIDGKEKVVVPQEAFGDNMLNIYKDKDEKYLYSADIRSVSENVSKPIRQLSIRILASTKKNKHDNIGVFIPNAGNMPIPLFVVFRALGILPDKEIMSFCTLQNEPPTAFVPYLEACVHDAASIITQHEAITYISMFVKGRSVSRTMRILADYFLPHVGEVNFLEKAYHLGYMTNRLLSVAVGIEPETDRDSYKYKRLTIIGPLLKDLFREYYSIQQKEIQKFLEERYEFGKDTYSDLSNLIYRKYEECFSKRTLEEGVRKAFKGNWGAYAHTKKVGIVQDMNRLSHNGMISHLRKTNLPMDASVKLVGPRVLHGSQWGIMDPIDTPDGGNIGLHKHLSIMTHVTSALSREPLIEWLKTHVSLKSLEEAVPTRLGKMTKVVVNGFWVGCIADPISMVQIVKTHRRHGLIPIMTSIMFDYARNTVILCCDGGRLCRPIMYQDDDKSYSFQQKDWGKIEKILKDPKTPMLWDKLISGFHEKKKEFNPYSGEYYDWNDLYGLPIEQMKESKSLLEYVDTQETEGAYVAMNYTDVAEKSPFTHCELHSSTTYGVMCNLINFLEHNPASRNSFSCGQSKQACSLYSTNYQVRMDKTAVVLNNGQVPLVKSRYLQYINNEENPYGENAIVAIMCYTGYNVEDAVLINEGALQRGMFRTTYFTTYEAHEEREEKNDIIIKDDHFGQISKMENVSGLKPDYDYSFLNEHGLVPEETIIDDKVVLIGETSMADQFSNKRIDRSKVPKKGQLGIVDKSFMTEGEEGERIAKVRIREERIPAMGDKFASRAGQKGTIGMIIPEENMPYTKDGVRPDMIINPHALPSRMTIGQMIECIVGKACCMEGVAGECTAFYNKENKLGMFGELLTKHNFHSTGDEILYDGMSGKQLEGSIFIGPTYYMRLKHMVKDKINYRATGPMTKLTRQPVHGRANDGGLRIGEMERDAVISHGMASFLQESMMHRGDAYKLAICNKSGMIAIYNEDKNMMISPSIDGPIKYSGSVERDGEIIAQQMTKHGRKFSIVHVPYTLKLLMQELQGLNVQMHIITDDNVEQFDNMKSSNTLDLFLGVPNATTQMIIEQIQEKLKETDEKEAIPESSKPNDDTPLPRDKISTLSSEESKPLNMQELNKRAIENNENRKPFNILDLIPNESTSNKEGMVMDESNEKNDSMDSEPYDPNSPYYDRNNPETSLPPSLYDPTVPVYDDPNSPRFNPNSPYRSYSSYKGGKDGKDGKDGKYQEGDKVFYEGDIKPQRLWTVNSVNKNSFTIDTEDLDLLNVEDSRKVVELKDIRKPNLFDIAPLEKKFSMPEMPQEDMAQNVPLIPMETKPEEKPMVNIIKIFNQGGVDNSQGEHTDVQPQVMGDNATLSQPTPFAIEAVPSVDAPIDFNNLVIKKTE